MVLELKLTTQGGEIKELPQRRLFYLFQDEDTDEIKIRSLNEFAESFLNTFFLTDTLNDIINNLLDANKISKTILQQCLETTVSEKFKEHLVLHYKL